MEIIAITSHENLEAEHSHINSLFKAGLKILHIRKPNYTTEEMAKFIMGINDNYHQRVVIHSHHELAIRFKLKGIHLTENHRKSKIWLSIMLRFYKILRPKLHISASYHSLSAIRKTKRMYAYVFFSPVFESISKTEHKSTHSLSKIKDGCEKTAQRIIGVGGMDEDKIPQIKGVGFFGIGLQGALWLSGDPAAKFRRIVELCSY
ncbi:MAG: thiamine phosphate synthase [Bacteroidetes bacterium]|nr:thiamine phosphate synthase [Bacteroidota bacterium]